MKKINILLIAFAFLVNVISFSSCNEDKLLTEIPLDFYSPENSYITNNQLQMAVNNLYYDMRYLYWGISGEAR